MNVQQGEELVDGKQGKILIIHYHPEESFLLESFFDDTFEVTVSFSVHQAIKLINFHEPDLILLEENMPTIHGHDIVRQLKQSVLTENIPIILIAKNKEKCNDTRGMKLGASDYIYRPFDRYIVKSRVKTYLQNKILLDKINELLNIESTTGLHNRQYFDHIYPRLWNKSLQSNSNLGLLLVKIDSYQEYKESISIEVLEALLKGVAIIINDSLEADSNIVCHYQEGDFICLLPNLSLQKTMQRARAIVLCTRSSQLVWSLNNALVPLTVSVGGISAIARRNQEETLITKAEDMLDMSRKKGGNTYSLSDVE